MTLKEIITALNTNKISLITSRDCLSFQEDDFIAIAEALISNTSLRSLDCGSRLTPTSLLKFASAFEKNNTLEDFDFYINTRSNHPQDWQAAARALYSALLINKILVVTRCVMHEEGFPFNKGINALSAINKKAREISADLTAIRNRPTTILLTAGVILLATLCLLWAAPIPTLLKPIALALLIMKTFPIACLFLYRATLRIDSAESQIKKINLTGYAIYDHGLDKPITSLLGGPPVKTPLEKLLDALSHNTTVTQLDLRNNFITATGLKQITALLKTNKTITKINLGGNLIYIEDSAELNDFLQVTQARYVWLKLDRNYLSNAAMEGLKNQLRVRTSKHYGELHFANNVKNPLLFFSYPNTSDTLSNRHGCIYLVRDERNDPYHVQLLFHGIDNNSQLFLWRAHLLAEKTSRLFAPRQMRVHAEPWDPSRLIENFEHYKYKFWEVESAPLLKLLHEIQGMANERKVVRGNCFSWAKEMLARLDITFKADSVLSFVSTLAISARPPRADNATPCALL